MGEISYQSQFPAQEEFLIVYREIPPEILQLRVPTLWEGPRIQDPELLLCNRIKPLQST